MGDVNLVSSFNTNSATLKQYLSMKWLFYSSWKSSQASVGSIVQCKTIFFGAGRRKSQQREQPWFHGTRRASRVSNSYVKPPSVSNFQTREMKQIRPKLSISHFQTRFQRTSRRYVQWHLWLVQIRQKSGSLTAKCEIAMAASFWQFFESIWQQDAKTAKNN